MVPNEELNFNPLEDVKDKEKLDKINFVDLVYERPTKFYFKKDTIAIGFLNLGNDIWILTGIVKITKNNGLGKPATAKYLDKKYNLRLTIKFHKSFENGIVKAEKFIDKLEVFEIWNPDKTVDDKSFPGYRNVKISYTDLKKKLETSDEWIAHLKSRKGVYLITDKATGKLYVGSAYGKNGILGRWKVYLKSGYDKNEKENGKYPNKKLQELVKKQKMQYVKDNFQYSILDTFTEEVSNEEVINRESWWKEILCSREFGYNAN